MTFRTPPLLPALALGLATLPLSASAVPAGGPLLRIGGSSTVSPILNEAIEAYRAAGNKGAIDLSETGSTDGFRRFCRGQLEIANASRPINGRELKSCASSGVVFLEFPIAFDAITVVVHPSNTWAKQISLKQLNSLWGR